MIQIPDFSTKAEKIAWLVTNKEKVIEMKKAAIKHADGISFSIPGTFGVMQKASSGSNKTELMVKAVINTTNLMDSHYDVHIPGLWDKSLNENKMIMHLQEHNMSFDKIISDGDDLKAYVQSYTWKELGFNFSGKTQALIFDSNVKADVNPFMFKQYSNGRVKNHSVGMRYVKLIFAVSDDQYGAEYEAWEKYYPEIANKEVADSVGYFWVVKEAKVIEGSAVPLGSNYATPTLETKSGADEDHSGQPSYDTGKTIDTIKQIFKTVKI